MISTLVILGLALVWAVVLLPDLIAKISRGRRSDTIRSFNTQLSSLGRSAPVQRDDNVIDLRERRAAGKPAGPGVTLTAPVIGSPQVGSPAPVHAGARPVSPALRKRRQDVLISLGAAALLTLLATVAFGGIFLYFHLAADLVMAAYLVALQKVGAARPAHSPVRAPTPSAHVSRRPARVSHMVRDALEPRRIAN